MDQLTGVGPDTKSDYVGMIDRLAAWLEPIVGAAPTVEGLEKVSGSPSRVESSRAPRSNQPCDSTGRNCVEANKDLEYLLKLPSAFPRIRRFYL